MLIHAKFALLFSFPYLPVCGFAPDNFFNKNWFFAQTVYQSSTDSHMIDDSQISGNDSPK